MLSSGLTNLSRHSPVQRHCRRMRANIPPLDQAHLTASQQFNVDVDAKIEFERLQFLRREQEHLRVDNYKDLWETIVNHDGDPRDVGQKVLLPATFCGGPRYTFERQQDTIAHVRKFGRPDLLITVTTNPKWTEILESSDCRTAELWPPGSTGESFSSENPKPFEDFERSLLWLLGGPSIEL